MDDLTGRVHPILMYGHITFKSNFFLNCAIVAAFVISLSSEFHSNSAFRKYVLEDELFLPLVAHMHLDFANCTLIDAPVVFR